MDHAAMRCDAMQCNAPRNQRSTMLQIEVKLLHLVYLQLSIQGYIVHLYCIVL